MSNPVLTVHFMDGTKLSVSYPRQSGSDAATIASNVKRAIDADKVIVEVDGDLLIILSRNVKYFHLTPAPPHLPAGVIRNGRLVS